MEDGGLIFVKRDMSSVRVIGRGTFEESGGERTVVMDE
jgi:hypothetical protein